MGLGAAGEEWALLFSIFIILLDATSLKRTRQLGALGNPIEDWVMKMRRGKELAWKRRVWMLSRGPKWGTKGHARGFIE